MKRKLVLLLAFVLSSCVPNEWVKADRATFDSIAPVHLQLLEQSNLPATRKETQKLVIDSWRVRLEKAEGR